jgi:enediyne biosynthesis protein E4
MQRVKTQIGAGLAVLFLAAGANAQSIQFQQVAQTPGSGISYQRQPSSTEAIIQAFRDNGHLDSFGEVLTMPLLSRGAPAVVLLDYDGDGDEDIFVTNNGSNSLYSNQFMETGRVEFVDRGSEAGLSSVDRDGTGACAGDIDNDGDTDLYVMSRMAPNVLYVNRGDGTFEDKTASSGLGAGILGHMSCSFGDIDNDGYLDVVVGNTFDWTSQEAILDPFAFNHPNQLFHNNGDGTFTDISERIQTHAGFPPGLENAAGLTWGIAMVDYDQDGDQDIIMMDDQGLTPPATAGGVDRGLIHLFQNDGTGHFTDMTVQAGLNHPGDWTGMTVADYNGDGSLDLFATNNGNWIPIFAGLPPPHDFNSRWYFGSASGAFTDPGVGALGNTPFGWAASSVDYDNDGYTDILYFGGLDPNIFIDRSNPGTILRNDGNGNFSFDPALAGSHLRRSDQAVAVGDLNNDGFVDVVTVSNIDIPAPLPIVPWPFDLGSPFDPLNGFVPVWAPDGAGGFNYTGLTFPNGSLSVELSSGNSNRSIEVLTAGSKGLTPQGRVNRSGIGAVVRFTPRDGKPATLPVSGAMGHASQDSRRLTFGLGQKKTGVLEVLWPGGVRNRLYGVIAGERILFPEIPCGVDLPWEGYLQCLSQSFSDLESAGQVTPLEALRFGLSALRFRSESGNP